MEIKEEMKQVRSNDEILLAYFEYNQLKNLYRQGWLRAGISKEKCESVADHSFGVAVLSLFTAEQYFPRLDSSKIVKMGSVEILSALYNRYPTIPRI